MFVEVRASGEGGGALRPLWRRVGYGLTLSAEVENVHLWRAFRKLGPDVPYVEVVTEAMLFSLP
jgi:hypothetical protein